MPDPTTFAEFQAWLAADQSSPYPDHRAETPSVASERPAYHRHNCWCSGWWHDDAACPYGEWNPCVDCSGGPQ